MITFQFYKETFNLFNRIFYELMIRIMYQETITFYFSLSYYIFILTLYMLLKMN